MNWRKIGLGFLAADVILVNLGIGWLFYTWVDYGKTQRPVIDASLKENISNVGLEFLEKRVAELEKQKLIPVPTVAVRVDASFRSRVLDIVAAVRAAAARAGAGLDVLLLDDAQLMRAARAAGQPFYPWRR